MQISLPAAKVKGARAVHFVYCESVNPADPIAKAAAREAEEQNDHSV